MKTKIFKTLTLAICAMAFSFTTNAQLPDFTRVDTGAIYESQGSPVNSSNMLFDVDNDGDYDPIICNMNAVGYEKYPLKLYKNEGEGRYIQKQFITDSENLFRVDVQSNMGDIDNDGDIDVIAQSIGHRNLGIFINDGYGNFLFDTILLRPKDNSSFYITIFPVVLDFNKDGFLDLISFDSVIVVYYNDGNGKFPGKDTIGSFNRIVNTDWLHSMDIGDMDNDGDMDIYCGLSRGVEKNALFINTGSSFEQVDENHITLSDTALTTSVRWVDYDNDGDMDIFTTNESLGSDGVLPALYENLGNLDFNKHIILDEIYRGSFTISDYWGDLDNDGHQDLFLTLEDGPLPFSGPYHGTYSSTSKNILYLNEGNGIFTNILDHTLTSGEAHTAKLLDHDNDGDLDVLTVGNSYDYNGHSYLYINEGNSNSFIAILCIDRYSCATPYGSRISAKSLINGEYVMQTRELSPFDGNASCKHSPAHFGMGDAEIIDSLIISWPSGHVDKYLNVKANQFYRAIEDDQLAIDFKATNYIQSSPGISDLLFEDIGESTTIDLSEYYHFIKGDTCPAITGDTLSFSIYNNENPSAVEAEVSGTMLSLEANEVGESNIQVLASAGFTERVDKFLVKVGVGLTAHYLANPVLISATPSPFLNEVLITYSIPSKSSVEINIYNNYGEHISTLISELKQQGEHDAVFDGSELAPGVYFCVLRTSEGMRTRKIIKLQ